MINGPMAALKDHLGREVSFNFPPQRIISLCPSQTETLFSLGAGPQTVGRTHFCIHPRPEIDKIAAVGGTKQVKIERIRKLEPDLIIGEKEENTAEMVEALSAEWPVYITDVRDYSSAIRMIQDLGILTGKKKESAAMIRRIETSFGDWGLPAQGLRCLYLIWRKPYMAAGKDTFIHSMMEKAGLVNVCAGLRGRYPQIDENFIRIADPQLILLSTEPFPFTESHQAELSQILPESLVELTDGEMWSWYGSRMIQAADYIRDQNIRWAQRFC